AADVEITKLMAKLCHLGVVTRGFAHGAFDCRNVGNLRADVEVNQFERVRKSGGLQHFTGGKEAGRIKTKLRVLACAGGPFAGAFAVKADADSNHRLDADFFRSADRGLELLDFLNDNHN